MNNPSVRPSPVTVISWFLIISGGFSLLMLLSPLTYDNWREFGINTEMAVINSVSGGVIQILCGWFMLKANSLGRTLYVIWIPVYMIITWLQMPGEYLPFIFLTLCFFTVVVYFLYAKDAREYFNGTYNPKTSESAAVSRFRRSQRSRSDLAQVAGIFFLIVSGFTMLMGLMVSGYGGKDVSTTGAILVFFIPAAIFLVPGIFLWGRKRWAAATGWTILVSSATMVLMSVTIWLVQGTRMWIEVETQADPEMINMLIDSGWNGFIGVIVAAVLLAWQYRYDWEQTEIPASPDLQDS